MTTFGEISKLKRIHNVIKSISYSQDEILLNIMKLLNIKCFDVDPCYSKGNFYKNISQPKYKFDINPQFDYVKKANSNNSVNSIIFDPPFCFNIRKNSKTMDNNNIMGKRFTMFKNFNELENMYKDSLKEFYRILNKKGILIFKCQDYTDQKTTMTHCLVYNWASELGFYAKDLLILLVKQRIFNPYLKQKDILGNFILIFMFFKNKILGTTFFKKGV